MVASRVRAPWYRLRVGGSQLELTGTPDNPTQNEALEGAITTVLDADVLATAPVAANQTATVYAVERIASTITAQFSGRVNHAAGQSYPNRLVLTCVGPLARLRRCPQHNHDLTGMTDGEAVQAILDDCNIAFDPDDILDCGYVLGAETSVYWQQDQPAHEVIADLDRVFGTATIEVGAGRVIRFAYDRAPDADNISVTYTRGLDAEFWGNQRDAGDLDAIVNLVQVRGASWEDSDQCTLTPWSRGVANNAQLGGSARNRSLQFNSDFIQDEALAAAIAERMLRWYNRTPDELTVRALNDQNVNCGDVIGVKDAAIGIDLSDDADATPYLVLTIDRRGDEMTLGCVGGVAGDTGTITTGVEKQCNDTSTTTDLPGLFDPPGIGYPPLIEVGTYDCPTDGGPNGVCPDGGGDGGGSGGDGACLVPAWNVLYGDWTTDDTSATFTGLSTDLCSVPGSAGAAFSGYVWIGADTYDGTQRVRVSGHVEMDLGVSDPSLFIGLHSTDESGASSGITVTLTEVDFFSWTGFDDDLEDVTGGFDFVLDWDPILGAFNATVAYAGGTLSHTQALGSWPASTRVLTIETNGNQCALGVTVTELCISHPEDLMISLPDWVEVDPTLSGIATLVLDQQGSAYDAAEVVDPSSSWTITARVKLVGAANPHDISIGLGNSGASLHYGVNLLSTPGDVMYVYSHNANDYLGGTPFGDGDWLDIVIRWSAGSTTLFVSVSDGVTTVSLSVFDDGSLPGFTLYPIIRSAGTPGDTGGMEVDAFTLTRG